MKHALRNVALLAFVALPLGILTLEVQTVIVPPTWMTTEHAPADALPAALFQFVVLFPSVVLGGVLNQILLWLLRGAPTRLQWRATVAASSLIIAAVILVVEKSALLGTWRWVAPTLVILIVYTFLAQPLASREPET